MNRVGTILAVAWVAILLVGCSAARWPAADSESLAAQIDVGIITVLPEEYHAVLRKLQNVRSVMEPDGRPNVYLWALGEIRSEGRQTPYRVVVAMAGGSGEVSGALATKETIDRWRPRDVLLVGIAGGIHDAVDLGDVVISTQIWAYEHGHLGSRYDSGGLFVYQADSALVDAAVALASDWRRRIEVTAPDQDLLPEVVVGKTASGNKVIENSSSAYFGESLRSNTSIVSVDMEGAGAGAAVESDRDMGGVTGFLMIRGISDLVEKGEEKSGDGGDQGRNPQRDVWKKYAADVAASFAAALIETNWPD